MHPLLKNLILSLSISILCLLGTCALSVGQDSKSDSPGSEKIYDTEKKTEGLLSPADSLRSIHFPPGFVKTLFAAEPEIRQPIAATTDPRGRVWICENYTYSDRELNFDLSLRDRIVILEDTDGDGEMDSRKVFWDQGTRLTSIEIGFGGVFVLCAPNLLFIPDRNRDDIPDGPPEILLDGWNDNAVRHNIANGLMWGPDGWLYGRHGILATSWVGIPGSSPSQRRSINCGIWRYHPGHQHFEVVAHGTTNPWGMDYDKNGNLFMINTVIGHLWHVVPGARFDRMYGSHFNPYTYETIGQTADHYHWNKSGGEAWSDTKKIGVTPQTDRFGGGHAHCGLMIYVDQSWPEKYHNTVFTCNLLGHRINNDRLEKKGNGFTGKHNPDFAKSTDSWFRGIELIRSHDDGFYILDWQDTGECHENDGVHRNSGRVFKVKFLAENVSHPAPNLYALSTDKLFSLITKSRWHFEKAAIVLRERTRASREEREKVGTLLRAASDRSPAIRFMKWIFSADHGADELFGENELPKKLNLITSEVLSETVNPGDAELAHLHLLRTWFNEATLKNTMPAADFFPELARQSRSPAVRLEIATCLPKLPHKTRLATAKQLLRFAEDSHDQTQPLLIWYGIEPLVIKFPSESANLAIASRFPKVTKLIARRLTERIENPLIAQNVISIIRKSPAKLATLTGIANALRGRRQVKMPNGWKNLVAELPDGDYRPLLDEIGVVFGDGKSLQKILEVATDSNGDPQMRGQALLTLAENQFDNLLDLLNQQFNDKQVRRYVIQAYAYCDAPEISAKLVNQFSNLKPASQLATINTLTKRKSWAMDLLLAVNKSQIEKFHISAWHARQIDNLGDEELSKKLEATWGTVRKSTEEKNLEIQLVRKQMSNIKADNVDFEKGKVLFQKTCSNCHVLFGVGGTIGPDLTGGNRHDLGYLLENIVDPGSSVAQNFRTSILNLVDGRTLTGVVLSQTENTLQLQTSEKIVSIARDDIEAIQPTLNSLMPGGLLNSLDAGQRRNLIGYLLFN
ncbi:MAG: c-type cytochrome [Pirellulaceae bacterium]|nr:c-type cytochrome [Pirellulaceae bacterium]